ncbi:MAG: putative outer rane efflux protein [Pseudomonadota bacterium]|jgi:outer membrane protein TolC
MTRPKVGAVVGVSLCVWISGCASVAPEPLLHEELAAQTAADRHSAATAPPIAGVLTLEEALARALKFNLDRRARMLEEALAIGQLDVSRLDMLPKLLANAGYTSRNNDRISQSRDSETGAASTSRFISQERAHTESGLALSWNMLDVSLGYYNAKSQADRVLIATERRRRAMHALMADVRTAYWRAYSAQKLRGEINEARQAARAALEDSRKSETERLRNPLDALRYQRQLLENLRLLESVEQELSRGQKELASLINAPLNESFTLAPPAAKQADDLIALPIEKLEEMALAQNAELREAHYNARIARDETRRTLSRLFPGVSFGYGLHYDTDNYLVNNRWNEVGMQLSFNLFNLFTGPAQMRLADAGVALADQRRVAMQMAVLTQVHLARLTLAAARGQLAHAEDIAEVDRKIREHLGNREQTAASGKLERISAQTSHILSLLRRDQAMSELQAASGRLSAALGAEPAIGSVDDLSLEALTRQVADFDTSTGPAKAAQ